MTLDEALSRATVSVPEWGKIIYGLGRNASYAAATRGDIITIHVGGKKRVPVALNAEKVGLRSTVGRAAA